MSSERNAPWWRWLLVPAAVAAAFVAVIYVNLFVIVLGPFPQDLAGPTAGALAALAVILSGALVAPKRRLVVAVALAILVVAVNFRLLLFWNLPVVVASACVVGFMAWLDSSRRTPHTTRIVKIAAWIGAFAFIGAVAARYVDLPARPDRVPKDLEHILGSGPAASAVYVYDLGGFIDHAWTWRLDNADADTVARITSALGLQPMTAVPQRFWTMQPYYWPRALPDGATAFSSPSFDADGREQDGDYYFLVHDVRANRAYVWYKSNF